jgi:hypothetical protein
MISGPYIIGSVKNDKKRFSSRLRSDEITMCEYMTLTFCKVFNYHDSRAYSYKRSEILPRLDGLGVEWFGLILA